MIIFRYDKTFDGLLTAVFDAYSRKTFPEILLNENETPPLFYDEIYTVLTDKEKSARVWKGLGKKISAYAVNMIIHVWLSELPKSDELIFRYIRKAFDSKENFETNFADKDVIEMKKLAIKVGHERHFLHMFARFQKTGDGIYFAPLAPVFNSLPLSINYFKDRFADQKWIIYDTNRNFGYYYDLKKVIEITLDLEDNLINGRLNEAVMAEDEMLFQEMWKNYFKSITIKERINHKLHRQNMPARYWKYMPEKN